MIKQTKVNQELFNRVVDTSKRAWNAVKEFIRRIRENIRKAVRRFIVINELRKQAVKGNMKHATSGTHLGM